MFDQIKQSNIQSPTILRVMQLSRDTAKQMLMLQNTTQRKIGYKCDEVTFDHKDVDLSDIESVFKQLASCSKNEKEQKIQQIK